MRIPHKIEFDLIGISHHVVKLRLQFVCLVAFLSEFELQILAVLDWPPLASDSDDAKRKHQKAHNFEFTLLFGISNETKRIHVSL